MDVTILKLGKHLSMVYQIRLLLSKAEAHAMLLSENRLELSMAFKYIA